MTDTLARPLEGRHAIVTGGARGIGLAIARRCLASVAFRASAQATGYFPPRMSPGLRPPP
ncbi:hypothetical protein [Variovorax sp. RO1]|uniref:hypothetical protein n=1 Tax=Variovorax sp. RO1 TaxID=2066034 RepID=UPI0026C9F4A3|nr:hypothetical protein [Variovorax sp. RO1]